MREKELYLDDDGYTRTRFVDFIPPPKEHHVWKPRISLRKDDLCFYRGVQSLMPDRDHQARLRAVEHVFNDV